MCCRVILALLAVATVGACATPASRFIEAYRLPDHTGPLYEIVADGQVVGWLYGSVHVGTAESPSISRAAIYAMAQTRHVYKENTDRDGNAIDMRDRTVAVAANAAAKKKEAEASVTKLWNGIIAAKALEKSTGDTVGLFVRDPSYQQTFILANVYCGIFYDYGTEEMAIAFAAGQPMTLHALETSASRLRDTADGANGCDTKTPASKFQSLPPETDEAKMAAILNERMCKPMRRTLKRQQTFDAAAYQSIEPETLTCFNDARHRRMAEGIDRAIRNGEKPFVVVGKAHLLSRRNLNQQLEARGYTLRRLD